MSKQTRTGALRSMIGRCVEIRRGDVRLVTGNLLGPLDMVRKGGRRMWGAAYGDDERLCVAAFDPLDAELAIQVAV